MLTVAPRAGAWIETFEYWLSLLDAFGRAPCGRVD